jgi:hypothetical protein
MSLVTQESPSTPRPVFQLLALILFVSLGLATAGCGGSGDENGNEQNGASAGSSKLAEQVDKLFTDAQGLVEDAKKVEAEKYASDDFEAAVRGLSKAQEYIDEGTSKSLAKAKRQIASSKRKLDVMIRDIGKLSKALKGLEEKIAEYEKKLVEANAVDAKKYAASEMEGAARSFEKAQGYIESGKSSSAGKYIGYAISDLNRALEEVKRKGDQKTIADQEKAILADKQKQALEAGAEQKALSDLEWARDQERKGDQEYQSGNFDMAARSFRDAKTGYVGAIEAAQRAASAAQVTSNNNNQRFPDQSSSGNGGSDEVPGIDQINIPDIGVEGDGDVATNLPGLFAGAAEYKSGTGSLALSWSDGTELKEDMKQLLGDSSHTHFEGDEGVGSGQDGAYVMAGNTKGYWIVNSSFEDGVRIRAKVLFQLLIDKPDFEILLMSNGGQDFYAVSYGATVRVYDDGLMVGNVKSPLPTYRKNPKDWVQKREAYDFEFVYYKRGEDKGVLEAKINGETTVKLKTDKFRKGFPGFRWNDTKFIIQELEVSGLVDQEWVKLELEKAASGERDNDGDDDIGF